MHRIWTSSVFPAACFPIQYDISYHSHIHKLSSSWAHLHYMRWTKPRRRTKKKCHHQNSTVEFGMSPFLLANWLSRSNCVDGRRDKNMKMNKLCEFDKQKKNHFGDMYTIWRCLLDVFYSSLFILLFCAHWICLRVRTNAVSFGDGRFFPSSSPVVVSPLYHFICSFFHICSVLWAVVVFCF